MQPSYTYTASEILARAKLPIELQLLIQADELAHLRKLPANVQNQISAAIDAVAAHYMPQLVTEHHEEIP